MATPRERLGLIKDDLLRSDRYLNGSVGQAVSGSSAPTAGARTSSGVAHSLASSNKENAVSGASGRHRPAPRGLGTEDNALRTLDTTMDYVRHSDARHITNKMAKIPQNISDEYPIASTRNTLRIPPPFESIGPSPLLSTAMHISEKPAPTHARYNGPLREDELVSNDVMLREATTRTAAVHGVSNDLGVLYATWKRKLDAKESRLQQLEHRLMQQQEQLRNQEAELNSASQSVSQNAEQTRAELLMIAQEKSQMESRQKIIVASEMRLRDLEYRTESSKETIERLDAKEKHLAVLERQLREQQESLSTDRSLVEAERLNLMTQDAQVRSMKQHVDAAERRMQEDERRLEDQVRSVMQREQNCQSKEQQLTVLQTALHQREAASSQASMRSEETMKMLGRFYRRIAHQYNAFISNLSVRDGSHHKFDPEDEVSIPHVQSLVDCVLQVASEQMSSLKLQREESASRSSTAASETRALETRTLQINEQQSRIERANVELDAREHRLQARADALEAEAAEQKKLAARFDSLVARESAFQDQQRQAAVRGDDLKKWEQQLISEQQQLKERRQQFENEASALEAEKKLSASTLEEARSQAAAIRDSIASREQAVLQLEMTMAAQRTSCDERERKCLAHEQHVLQMQVSVRVKEQALNELQCQLDRERAEAASTKLDLQQRAAELTTQELRLADNQAQLDALASDTSTRQAAAVSRETANMQRTHQLDTLERKIIGIQSEVTAREDAVREQFEFLQEQREHALREITDLDNQQLSMQQTILERQEELQEIEAKATQLQAAAERYQERVQQCQADIDRKQAELQEQWRRFTTASNELQQREMRISTRESEDAAMHNRVVQAEQALARQLEQVEQRSRSLNTKEMELKVNAEHQASTSRQLEAMLQSVNEQSEQLHAREAELSNAKEQFTEKQTRCESKQHAAERLQRDCEHLHEGLVSQAATLAAKAQDLEQMQQEVQQAAAALDTRIAEVETSLAAREHALLRSQAVFAEQQQQTETSLAARERGLISQEEVARSNLSSIQSSLQEAMSAKHKLEQDNAELEAQMVSLRLEVAALQAARDAHDKYVLEQRSEIEARSRDLENRQLVQTESERKAAAERESLQVMADTMRQEQKACLKMQIELNERETALRDQEERCKSSTENANLRLQAADERMRQAEAVMRDAQETMKFIQEQQDRFGSERSTLTAEMKQKILAAEREKLVAEARVASELQRIQREQEDVQLEFARTRAQLVEDSRATEVARVAMEQALAGAKADVTKMREDAATILASAQVQAAEAAKRQETVEREGRALEERAKEVRSIAENLLTQQQEVDERQAELQRLRQSVEEASQASNAAQNNLMQLREEEAALSTRVESMREDAAISTQKSAEAKEQLANIQSALEAMSSDADVRQQALTAVQMQLETNKREFQQQLATISAKELEQAETLARLQTMQADTEASYENAKQREVNLALLEQEAITRSEHLEKLAADIESRERAQVAAQEALHANSDELRVKLSQVRQQQAELQALKERTTQQQQEISIRAAHLEAASQLVQVQREDLQKREAAVRTGQQEAHRMLAEANALAATNVKMEKLLGDERARTSALEIELKEHRTRVEESLRESRLTFERHQQRTDDSQAVFEQSRRMQQMRVDEYERQLGLREQDLQALESSLRDRATEMQHSQQEKEILLHQAHDANNELRATVQQQSQEIEHLTSVFTGEQTRTAKQLEILEKQRTECEQALQLAKAELERLANLEDEHAAALTKIGELTDQHASSSQQMQEVLSRANASDAMVVDTRRQVVQQGQVISDLEAQLHAAQREKDEIQRTRQLVGSEVLQQCRHKLSSLAEMANDITALRETLVRDKQAQDIEFAKAVAQRNALVSMLQRSLPAGGTHIALHHKGLFQEPASGLPLLDGTWPDGSAVKNAHKVATAFLSMLSTVAKDFHTTQVALEHFDHKMGQAMAIAASSAAVLADREDVNQMQRKVVESEEALRAWSQELTHRESTLQSQLSAAVDALGAGGEVGDIHELIKMDCALLDIAKQLCIAPRHEVRKPSGNIVDDNVVSASFASLMSSNDAEALTAVWTTWNTSITRLMSTAREMATVVKQLGHDAQRDQGLEADLDSADEEIQDLRKQLDALAADKLSISSALSKVKRELNDALRDKEAVSRALKHMQESAGEEYLELQQKYEQLQQQHDTALEDLQKVESQFQRAKADLNQTLESVNKLQLTAQQQAHKFDALAIDHQSSLQQSQAIKSEMEQLQATHTEVVRRLQAEIFSLRRTPQGSTRTAESASLSLPSSLHSSDNESSTSAVGRAALAACGSKMERLLKCMKDVDNFPRMPMALSKEYAELQQAAATLQSDLQSFRKATPPTPRLEAWTKTFQKVLSRVNALFGKLHAAAVKSPELDRTTVSVVKKQRTTPAPSVPIHEDMDRSGLSNTSAIAADTSTFQPHLTWRPNPPATSVPATTPLRQSGVNMWAEGLSMMKTPAPPPIVHEESGPAVDGDEDGSEVSSTEVHRQEQELIQQLQLRRDDLAYEVQRLQTAIDASSRRSTGPAGIQAVAALKADFRAASEALQRTNALLVEAQRVMLSEGDSYSSGRV